MSLGGLKDCHQRRALQLMSSVHVISCHWFVSSCVQQIAEEEDAEFVEEFLSKRDPSILRFLLAAGDDVSRNMA